MLLLVAAAFRMRDGVAKQKFTGGKKKVKICFREASVSDQWRKGSRIKQ